MEKAQTTIKTLVVITLLSGAVLSTTRVSAESTTANATVTVGSACTMTATVNTAHTAEVPAGSSKTDIGSTTLNTICNDAGGYAIYAVGYTGNEYGNNKMSNGTVEFNTGTGTSASNWNMSLNQITTGTYATTIDNGFTSYSAIPATYTKVAHRDSVTDSTTGSSINLTYGAYITTTQATGDYIGKVKFTMVHPASEIPLQPVSCPSGHICYNPNGSNVVGTMGSPAVSSSATSAMLLASNYSRTGYGFAGWSDAYDYTTNSNAHFYGPQEGITFTAGQYTGSNNGLALYAVWVKSEGSIQDTSKVASICKNLTTAPTDGTANLASVSALTDQRDNETYAIAKLADGNCWMIENLRLESTNSDNSTGALAQGYGTSATYGNFRGLADAESEYFSNSTNVNSLYYSDTQTGTASINIGTSGYPAYRMPRYNNLNTPTSANDRPQNPTSNAFSNNNTTVGMYSYGNYYTWSAAMANTIYYSGSTAKDDDGRTSETVSTSLCPTGWRLPYGRSTGNGATAGGFSNLDIALGGTGITSDSGTDPTGETMSLKWRSYPNNFLYAGSFYASSANNRGYFGNYWTSTANGTISYRLILGGTSVYPGTNDYSNFYGQSIRCVVSSR